MADLKPGRELNVRIAEEVLGWKRILGYDGWTKAGGHPSENAIVDSDQLPRFSEDIAAARTVLEKLKEDGFEFGIDEFTKDLSACVISIREGEVIKVVASETAETLPHAICLAALKAVGYLQD